MTLTSIFAIISSLSTLKSRKAWLVRWGELQLGGQRMAALDVARMDTSEIVELCQEWQSHFDQLEGRVREKDLSLARLILRPENFGFEQGQIRPVREFVNYDLLYVFVPSPANADEELLLLCRLTRADVRRASREDDFGEFDPDDFPGRLMVLRAGLARLGHSLE